jgi:septum formation protein
MEAFIATEEWCGVAGGYRIQGRAEAFVTDIQGSYSGIVGLPLYETLALLQGLGYRAA